MTDKSKCECCGARYGMGWLQWIKCSDRLPDPSDTVIGFSAHNGVILCIKDEFVYEDVKYWMPLPDKPND